MIKFAKDSLSIIPKLVL